MPKENSCRILFLASNPLATSRLDLEEELRGLENELRAARFRDDIRLTIGHAVRPDDLVRLLRDVRPAVVHFSGHGSPEGIVLRSDTGHMAVSAEALQRLFRDRGIELVVLNACFSQDQAKAISTGVSAVVGTSAAVGDEAARRFSIAFYRTLGNGNPIEEAFRDGGDAVVVHGLQDVFLSFGNLSASLCGRHPELFDGQVLCLPAKPPLFVGREAYLEKLRRAMVEQNGIFLLSGEPGVGKSILAQMFAWQVVADFEAIVFQTCGRRRVDLIVAELADALKPQLGDQVAQLPPDKKVALARGWLQQRRSLLILDDVWLDEAPEAIGLGIQDLLPGNQVSVLFTSRSPTLPWVAYDNTEAVHGFTAEEAEAAFRKVLGTGSYDRNRRELLAYAERTERLPIAVVVGAQLLQGETGPLNGAARSLMVGDLANQIHDVPSLFGKAIEAQGESERALLCASAMCSQQGFWLPFVASIAGLDADAASRARTRLVSSALLRVLDHEKQRFQLHALTRETVLALMPDQNAVRERHANRLEAMFKDWTKDWQSCRECLAEVLPAMRFLWTSSGERAQSLCYDAYAMSIRVGKLESAYEMERAREQLCSSSKHFGKVSVDDLLDRYGGQAVLVKVEGGVSEKGYLEIGLENKGVLANSYSAQAIVLGARGRLQEAMTLHKKEEAVRLQIGDKHGLARSYGNQAALLAKLGRAEEAWTLHKKEEAMFQELGDKNGLSKSYGNQALLLTNLGRLEEAWELHKKEEALFLQLGNEEDLAICHLNEALILKAWGQHDEAMELLKKAEGTCTRIGNKPLLVAAYCNQAKIAKDSGQLEEAMKLHKKAEAVLVELDDIQGLGECYGNQALILQHCGRFAEAMEVRKREERILMEFDDKGGLQESYANQALILEDSGRLEDALTVLKKEEVICIQLGFRDCLRANYGRQGLILKALGRFDEALAALKKEEAICDDLGHKNGLAVSHGNQGLVLKALGRFDEALASMKRSEVIWQELGSEDGLQCTYGNEAVILELCGRLEEALQLYRKAEVICLKLRRTDHLRIWYQNMAWLLSHMGRQDEAEKTLKMREALGT